MPTLNKKILGIDFGLKNIGIAISYMNIAMPYITISNDKNVFTKIKEICDDEKVDFIVLGLPLNASGSESDRTHLTKQFFSELKKNIDLEIFLEDERYSTKNTIERLKKSSYKASKIKKIKDMNSACIIIENFLKKNGSI